MSVLLVPRDGSSVTLGTLSAKAVMSTAPDCSNCSPEKTLTAIGTSSRLSSRRLAVMMMASVGSATASASAGESVSWAVAGVATRTAASAATEARLWRGRVMGRRSSPLSPAAAVSALSPGPVVLDER